MFNKLEYCKMLVIGINSHQAIEIKSREAIDYKILIQFPSDL